MERTALLTGVYTCVARRPHWKQAKGNVCLWRPGRFGFVEMRTEELASSAMAMDKVDLCGRAINVGRPKGYVEPPQVGLCVICVHQPSQKALWQALQSSGLCLLSRGLPAMARSSPG